MGGKILKISLICAGAILSIFLLLLVTGILLNHGILKRKGAQPEVTVKYTPGGSFSDIDEGNIADSEYQETLQEALYRNGIEMEGETEYQKNIDEIIKTFENDDYISIFFRSVRDSKLECFTMAKFKKKTIDGKVKYVFLTSIPRAAPKDGWYIDNFEENIRGHLTLCDFMQNVNISPESTRFLYGESRFKEIYQLQIEGQKPTEIIPYEIFGEQWYFWYYEDLQSSKVGSQIELTVD